MTRDQKALINIVFALIALFAIVSYMLYFAGRVDETMSEIEATPETEPKVFNIYDMKLHERHILVLSEDNNLEIIRVAGGWIYKNNRHATFVPVPER